MQAGAIHAPKILTKRRTTAHNKSIPFRHGKSHPKQSVVESKSDDDLLVFGYASKLYPPDTHSAAISKNKHLILWNEDPNVDLLIDRYDGRASLFDLSEFDGDSWNKKYQLSEEETKLEEHLDEERYRALHMNELEESIRQEEEMKRLHASITSKSYEQVGYAYQDDEKKKYPPRAEDNEEGEMDEKLFTAPASLAVPKQMEIPPTEKMHAIIEKTADFVSKQGTQMEIVLKAKQSNNSQFQFLQFGHYLNPYYKHMVSRIKDGKYKPGEKNDNNNEEDSDSSSDGEGYLHPSLFAAAHKQHDKEKEEKTKAIRTIDPDHPLAKLIEKGRAANAAKQYQHMVDTVYKYYNQQQYSEGNVNAQVEPPPLPPFEAMTSQFSNDVTFSYPHYHDAAPPPPGEDVPPPPLNINLPSWDDVGEIVPPPPDMQPIVEFIARKVATEGEKCEMSLATQDEPNYAFLRPWHELHPYYKYRKMAWKQTLCPPPPPEIAENEDESKEENFEPLNEEKNVEEREVKPSAPISFSIKVRNETSGLKVTASSTKASKVLAEVESDGEEPPKKDVTTKEHRKVRRRFTEEPMIEYIPMTEKTPSKEKTADEHNAGESPPETSVNKSLHEIIEVQSIPGDEKDLAKASNFTAVTPSGEVASVSLLRQKQEARRMKALQFLKTKQEEKATQKPTSLNNPANEDIFDLSNSPNSDKVSTNDTLPSVIQVTTDTESIQEKKSDGSDRSCFTHANSPSRNRRKHKSRDRSTSPTRKHKRHKKQSEHKRENNKNKKRKKKMKNCDERRRDESSFTVDSTSSEEDEGKGSSKEI